MRPGMAGVMSDECGRSCPFFSFSILLGPPACRQSPASVRDHRGREVLEVVRSQDRRYLTNHDAERRYQGATAPHRLTIELQDAEGVVVAVTESVFQLRARVPDSGAAASPS